MSVLHLLNHSINIELFSTFAGLSLVALGIVGAIQVFYSNKENLPDAANRYFSIAFFVASFIIFILGLFATLIFNSLSAIWFRSLVFWIVEVSLKSILLLVGIMLLIGGIDALVLMVLKRGLRGFPRNCGLLMCVLELFLPPEPNSQNNQRNSATKGCKKIEHSENAEDDGRQELDKRKRINQLVNQLKIVFIFMLLTLWLAVLNEGKDIPVKRMEGWYFVVLSVAFLFYYCIWGRKKIVNLCYKWLTPLIILGLLWGMYWISGIQLSGTCFFVISGILFLWTIAILSALVLVRLRNGRQKRLDMLIIWVARNGEIICWPLSIATFFASVLLAWQRLFNEGASGCWVEPLLIFGIIVSLVISLLYPMPENDKHG